MGNDPLIRHRVVSLVSSEYDDYLGPGFLYAVPPNLYMEWARKDTTSRASIVIKWLPITVKTEDGALSWHPALQSFVLEFGEEGAVLAALSSRLHPRSWWGSLAPHLEPQVKLLESWATHPRPKVGNGLETGSTGSKLRLGPESAPETISRCVAGIWLVWSVWSIGSYWFIWLDERERQESPHART